MKNKFYLLTTLIAFLVSCDNGEDHSPIHETNRSFKMGFTTWSYGPTQQNVNQTYSFIENNADIYTEQIDNKIPWDAWINDTTLPIEFTNEVARRLNNKIEDKPLLLAVSLLNTDRNDLAEDFNGLPPTYTNLNDPEIAEAYFKHISYLVDQFSPEYLVIAIEVNELRLRAENKWNSYTLLMENVTGRIKQLHPNLKISESISLHNLYEPEITNAAEYINEIVTHMNQMDFVSISFYPFLKNQHTKIEFQRTFDFLHSKINKPIAFVETSHIAENLSLPNFNLDINGNEEGQNIYLETLIDNAEQQDYEFVIWWAHRDYDALWETFPDEVKDIGKLWRDTGLLDENGTQRLSYTTWKTNLDK
ncbi:glycosyl hydrolase 53 family protein [uncultured Maribacter sp.]|uniref:glycosyl hydrolase 53 family protein n=1 Tax=uncultured Maribacter sp. TaxID=431308 RepID=UPI00261D53E9|nr:glycosyl hydrolase 53 family protein [uncultured Maribacter sp.]